MKAGSSTYLLGLLILTISFAFSATAFEIDFNSSIIESNRQWTRVKLGFKDGQQPIEIYYDEYPTGWNQVINYIYIPADQRGANRKYPCRLRAKDKTGAQIKATVIFIMSNQKIYLSDILFAYDQVFEDDFFNSGIFSGKPELVKANGTSTLELVASNEQFLQQADIVSKLTQLTEKPGVGIADFVNGVTSDNKTIAMVNVQASIKLRQDLKNSVNSQLTADQSATGGSATSGTISTSGGQTVTTTTTTTTTTSSSSSSSGAGSAGSVLISGGSAGSLGGATNIQQAANQANIIAAQQLISSSSSSNPLVLTTVPVAVIGSVVPTTTLSANEKQLTLINSIKVREGTQYTQQRSIQSIFFKLPGPQELDSIILTADSLAIIKTIQKVIQSQLTCEQKISYLSDFFGRIQSAISMKAFAASQLSVIVEGAQIEINRLTAEIDRNRKSIQKLGLADLRSKLNAALVQLEQSYSTFNSADSSIQPKQALIAGYRKDIEIIRTRADQSRQEIPVQKIQLTQINANIAKLEQQLADAKAKRAVYEVNINKLQTSIKSYDLKIQENRSRIDVLQAQISKREAEADKLKSNYNILQIQIERQRVEITKREKRQAEILVLIPNLEQRAAIEQKKLNTVQLQRLRAMVKNLQAILPGLKQQIDQSNFRCNQIKTVEPVKQGEALVYVVIPKEFNTYIETCYKVKPDTTNLKNPKITIAPISILDNVWRTNYGNPYQALSFAQTRQFAFNQDFNCLNPSTLETGYGVITNINKKYVDVDNSGRKARLNLGACSRMQSTSQLPKVGQKIYYRGKQVQKGEFNLYKGSCI